MRIKNKNRKEDMKILVSLGSEYRLGTRFRLVFTAGSNGNNFVCELNKKAEYIHCVMVDDSHVLCLLDNHNLHCGRLEVEIYLWLDDPQMPDGNLQLVSKDVVRAKDNDGEYGVCLTNGVSDDIEIMNVNVEMLHNVIKGDAATIDEVSAETIQSAGQASVINEGNANHAKLHFYIPRGEVGPRGERGEKGEPGQDADIAAADRATKAANDAAKKANDAAEEASKLSGEVTSLALKVSEDADATNAEVIRKTDAAVTDAETKVNTAVSKANTDVQTAIGAAQTAVATEIAKVQPAIDTIPDAVDAANRAIGERVDSDPYDQNLRGEVFVSEYPLVLYANGTPSIDILPLNLPKHLPWNGTPENIYMRYIDISKTSGGMYYSRPTIGSCGEVTGFTWCLS